MSDPLSSATAELVAIFLESLDRRSQSNNLEKDAVRDIHVDVRALYRTSGLNIHRAIQGFVDQVGHLHHAGTVGDSFLTYRLFIVWDRAWRIIIIPILLLIGTGISGYGGCYRHIHEYFALHKCASNDTYFR
ncbi:hypothetical protein A0H81_05109 [Grifola frondosa]|uniref:Uncharacterized protein n=1 Tax=Grifola frondosa TaxID=5627 RepID=A0A1C7ME13_GRIFR|nr:hypothetical protein A0H81_05109 [Grifola frondosa]